MPTKQWGSTALCIGTTLIVAGGVDKSGSPLQTVEVLDTETLQWSTAADLPQSLSSAPVAVCGGQLYILGKFNMYMCSLCTLIQSSKSFLGRRFVEQRCCSMELRGWCTTSHTDHPCVRSWSAASNWWDGFKYGPHDSRSHVQPQPLTPGSLAWPASYT